MNIILKITCIIIFTIICISCKQQIKPSENKAGFDRAEFNKNWAYVLENYKILRFKHHLIPDQMIDSITNSIVSYYLYGFQEENLSKSQNKDNYTARFLWLRSFHQPLVFKIEKKAYNIFFTMKSTDSGRRFYVGTVNAVLIKKLSDSFINTYDSLLNSNRYWELSPETELDKDMSDGAYWVLEVNKNGEYHIVIRNSPGDLLDKRPNKEELIRFKQCCKILMDLSDIDSIKTPLY